VPHDWNRAAVYLNPSTALDRDPDVTSPGQRTPLATRSTKVLAVCSGGGHWVQMKRILPAFDGMRLSIMTVEEDARGEVDCEHFFLVRDASLWSKGALALSALRVAWIVLRTNPNVVISTGAAPGFFALVMGKLMRAKTIWVDSIANAECLSLSGKKARRFTDLWLTQWPHLAREGGSSQSDQPEYMGSVL
jgi:UDP-N-acetylglucosamine:LPS N-acetylglucosamine transferase